MVFGLKEMLGWRLTEAAQSPCQGKEIRQEQGHYQFFWVTLGFELDLIFARQALYHLSHSTSPEF
jgi:hypothetical protein